MIESVEEIRRSWVLICCNIDLLNGIKQVKAAESDTRTSNDEMASYRRQLDKCYVYLKDIYNTFSK